MIDNESLIEKLEALKSNWGGSNPWQEGYLKAIDKAIFIVRRHYEGRPAVEGKPLELMTRDELLAYIKQHQVEQPYDDHSEAELRATALYEDLLKANKRIAELSRGYPVMTDRQMIERLKDALHRMVNATMYKDHPAESEFAIEVLEDADDYFTAMGDAPVSTVLQEADHNQPSPARESMGSPVRYTDGTISREYDEQPACSEISLPRDHGMPCYYCGEPCDSLAGNPGKWPVILCHKDAPGGPKAHHSACVSSRLEPVSLEVCTKAIWQKHHQHAMEDLCRTDIGQWEDLPESEIKDEWREKARAVLQAAGVKYHED